MIAPTNYFMLASANSIMSAFSSLGTLFFAMTDAVAIAVVGGIVTVITSLGAAYFAYRAKTYAEEAKNTSKEASGHMDEMLRLAKDRSRAEGVAEGKIEGKIEAKAESKETTK